MSNHLKRLVAPESWRIPKKVQKFVMKTAPGPHNAGGLPVGVWLREHIGIAQNASEVRKILHQRDVLVNGRPCRNPQIGLGVFDIVSIPKLGKHYRIQLDKLGNLISVEIPEESAKTRLCKIRNKTVIKGGKVQLNLAYGANILADNTYKAKDSIVVTLGTDGEDRFRIIDHFPFAEGNVAMIVGGKHSGKVGRIVEIIRTASSVPNRVVLVDDSADERFETIEEYIFMVGRSGIAPELEASV
ncbi:30S ribosomal protein S4e [Methanoculleus bourgensis]|jgi:small subunit ribosomal protein S4e|uniref:Small ribosomal subunit protein eS4 n=1 Tax=Methanoculleus bourgensis TaxID=83986 RepID=A0A0X3BNB8_9EURY|nr:MULTISPECIES: 30S ribosomal protein S4e [Methanoculleus]NQS73197.1 30S ribosomal protein S4e [Methanoculleus sp.]MBT0732169.1 30S ribosomal protein S4e [Methanoculleus bourgensis]MDD3373011.1 30S ribosomal protein S4e [Methanoculleus bourgensis]NMA88036.1 30S ribosomal protein S4e [Methanoculleus bourgensis]CVK33389.1 30S ribosomal protein S4e [Methanoculleus bourgensis]